MAVSFKIPSSPSKSIETIDDFVGVDFTNSPAHVDENKSPNAINMVRDVPSKVRKRMGYEVIEDWSDESKYVTNLIETYFDEEVNNALFNDMEAVVNSGTRHYVSSNRTISISTSVDSNEQTRIAYINGSDSGSHSAEVDAGKYVIVVYHISGEVPKTSDDHLTFTYKVGSETTKTISLTGDKSKWSAEITVSNDGTNIDNVSFRIPFDIVLTNADFGVALYHKEQYSDDTIYSPYDSDRPSIYTINGYHKRRKDKYAIVHIGNRYYQNGMLLYANGNDHISHSWQFNDNLYIIDGKQMLVFNDDVGLAPLSEVAYVPTITIAKTAAGKADSYESLNLVTPAFIEQFISDSTQRAFQMNFGNLDSTEVIAWVLNSSGDWVRKYENTHFTVNRTTGVVTFNTAPGTPPVTGEDNVKIQAYRTVEGYADRINHCTFGTRFGVNGAFDRLFLSGNPDDVNTDWHSEQWDCTYFPDTGYSLLGSSKSAVVGYSIISNYLAAHKDENDTDTSVIIREGDLVDNEATFKIINTLQGDGAIASNSFAYLSTEPLFLTRSGLYAVTAQDITGEKYSQSRSFYLNGKLTKESYKDLQNSFACVYDNMYLLSVANERLYILDGLQPIRTDKSEPYSTRQYAAFYCNNLPINCMWQTEHRLYFGTPDGKICRFYNDKNATKSYSDNGQAIVCQWETPDIDGKLFYKNKSLRYLAVRVGAAIRTSLKIDVMERGLWKHVKTDNTFGRYFSFSNIDFSKFTFSNDKEEHISRTKLRVKKVDKYRIRLTNDQLNEPFTLYNMAMEYVENGNFKG